MAYLWSGIVLFLPRRERGERDGRADRRVKSRHILTLSSMVNKEFNVPYTIGCQQFLHSAAMFKMSFVAARRRGGRELIFFSFAHSRKALQAFIMFFLGLQF